MEWINEVVKSQVFLIAAGLLLISVIARFYLKHAQKFEEEDYPTLSEGEYHWLIWPAMAANYIFEHVFGKRQARLTLTEESLENLVKEKVLQKKDFKAISNRLFSTFTHAGKYQRQAKKLEDLQKQWDQIEERLSQLQKEAYVYETRVEEKDRLKHEIEKLKAEQKTLENQLEELERQFPADPSNVPELLQDLKDREYSTEKLFVSALEGKLGKEPAAYYKSSIIRHANKKTRFRDLLTWRSVSATFLVSLLANILCLIIVLISMPTDFHEFDPQFQTPEFQDIQVLKIIGLSYLVFMFFNFWGDLVSVSITRHVVAKIVAKNCNFLHYIAIDGLGIAAGYIVTLLPTISLVIYCWFTREPLNQWIHTGLLGNAIIPFFLFIFATSGISPVLTIFAFIAVLSITIPTVMYLSLMVVSYLGFRLYLLTRKEEKWSKKIEGAFRFVVFTGLILLLLAVALKGLEIYLQ